MHANTPRRWGALWCFILFAGWGLPRPAAATPIVLRMAAIAPEGTSWSRELKAFAREVETETDGAVRIKWYLGAIAGDELEMLEHIKARKLDGAALAAATTEVAPSLRVLRVVGLLRTWDEAHAILHRMRPTAEAEAVGIGLKVLGVAIVGSDVLFTRAPVRDLSDAKAMRYWIWSVDRVARMQLEAMGWKMVPLDLAQAFGAFETGAIDAFFALPTAALAYQWFVHTPAYVDLQSSFLPGSLVIRREVLDGIPFEAQKVLHAAGAKLGARFEDTSRTSQKQLMGEVFRKRGSVPSTVSSSFHPELIRSARKAQAQIPAQLLPAETIARVEQWLRELRNER